MPEPAATPLVIEHRRGWLAYWRGIDSATNRHDDPVADAWRGFWLWVRGFFYRGYATDDDGTPYQEDVYLCPWVPEKLRAHEAAHTAVFGKQFKGLVSAPDPNGSLNHEPIETFDVMLPGYWSFLRFTDRRGIRETYREWKTDGRIITRHEG